MPVHRSVPDVAQKRKVLLMMKSISENDWRLFRSKISDWQEAYIEKLNKDYINILSGDGYASERFWKLAERIQQDKSRAGVQCARRRSNMQFAIISLLRDGAITLDDLSDFTEELQNDMKHYFDQMS